MPLASVKCKTKLLAKSKWELFLSNSWIRCVQLVWTNPVLNNSSRKVSRCWWGARKKSKLELCFSSVTFVWGRNRTEVLQVQDRHQQQASSTAPASSISFLSTLVLALFLLQVSWVHFCFAFAWVPAWDCQDCKGWEASLVDLCCCGETLA